MPNSTLKESSASRASRPVRLLIRVLIYDDLIRDVASLFRLGESPVSVGRAERSVDHGWANDQLRLDDRWVSAAHAAIEPRGDLLVLRDLGSSNGTFLNGARVERQVLADGDLIEIGHTLFVLRELDPRSASALEAPWPDPTHDGVFLGPTRTLNAELAESVRRSSAIAETDQPVLILAESGAGKEVAAAAIHQASKRSGPFVAIDCGAIPESLFESTLFGHERGAFTGAEAKVGEIERARGGTLFLDEVGNLSPANQAKLLRVIETQMVTPLGGAPRRADLRWIAATNRDVDQDGAFRSDLFHRLAGFVVRIPPLRARREDLGILSRHLLLELGARSAPMSLEAARELFLGPLPGNVRQLRAILRSAAVLAAGKAIEEDHIRDLLLPRKSEPSPPRSSKPAPPSAARGEKPSAERVEAALRSTAGNVVHAASLLGVHPRQVYRWIKEYEIPLDDLRSDN
ncbi:MAG: sigma 54-interacting transcriptional regulator [Deltaproteobacteria bacterium]|nr:sigma 54-interacting transcriptional regulator [Deltaproteobacteria bacterium]